MYFFERLRDDLRRGRADYFANPALNLARWMLRDKAAQRRLALR